MPQEGLESLLRVSHAGKPNNAWVRVEASKTLKPHRGLAGPQGVVASAGASFLIGWDGVLPVPGNCQNQFVVQDRDSEGCIAQRRDTQS